MHFVWNAVDVSIIIIHAYSLCEKVYVHRRIILYTNFEPNTLLLSFKNSVRNKNAFEGMGSRLSSRHFSELLFQGIFTFFFFFFFF